MRGGGPTAGSERNDDVWKFILSNVRQPDHMAGDLHAQMASGEVGAQRLTALCDRTRPRRHRGARRRDHQRSRGGHPGVDPRPARPGRTAPSAVLDLADGSRIDIVCAITVDPDAGEITVDYEGSSPASPWGINVVKNYTHAYTTFTVRSVLNPDIPNNHGSLAPIKVEAPEGSIVNAVSPQPGTARHVVGMFLPNALLKALAQIEPEQAMAEGSGAVWTMQVNGNHDDGSPFITAMFTYAGGVGARATKPGLDACSYPTGVAAVPIEVVEASAPIRFRRKALRPGSGGHRCADRWARPDHRVHRRHHAPVAAQRGDQPARRCAPQGIFGGEAGAAGRFSVNGEPVTTQARITLQPDDVVRLDLPGGGGYGGGGALTGRQTRTMEREHASPAPDDTARRAARRTPTRSESPRRRADAAGRALHIGRVPARSRTTRSSPTSGCASGGRSGSPNPATGSPSTIADEPLIVVRDKDGTVNCLSAVCQHRAMQVCEGSGNVDAPSRARTTTGTTPSTAACSARRRWSARQASTRQDFRLPALPVELWAGFVFVNMDRDAAPLAPTLASYEPYLANYDLDARRLPVHVHAHRPAVELEGDVRELQRRLPRQPAAPVRPGLLPERNCRVPRRLGRRLATSSSAPPATPTSTAGSTPRTTRSCRCSPS